MKRTLGIVLITMIAALSSIAQETKSAEAVILETDDMLSTSWVKKDRKPFDANLLDTFIFVYVGGVLDKATFVNFIGENPCAPKSFSPSDRRVREISDGVALMTGSGISETVCDEVTFKTYALIAVLWVREGGTWKAAYRQVIVTKEETVGSRKDVGEDEPDPDDEDTDEEALPEPQIPNDPAMAKTLLEIEDKLFDAWAKKDTRPFEKLLTANFISLSAEGVNDRAAEIRSVKENPCKVDDYSISNAKATKVNDGLYIFTSSVEQDATCDGDPMNWGGTAATIYTKEGSTWKPLFHMVAQN